MNKKFHMIILLFLVLAMACKQNPTESSKDAADVEEQFRVEGELPSGTVVQGWIKDAAIDLAQRLDVEVSDVTYIAFDVPVWPDASYGCPQPGQEYEAVIKEGYQIELRVNGRNYFYHGGEDIAQFLCEDE